MAAVAEDRVHLPRVTKGVRPHYFDSPETDQVMMCILALMSEVSALRERQDTIERLLAEKGVVTRADMEGYRPDGAAEQERSAWNNEFIRRVMRINLPEWS